jgi:superfamily II DNA or RNA helicase
MICSAAVLETVTRQAVREGHYDKMAKVVLEEMPSWKPGFSYYGISSSDCLLAMRDFRIGLYMQDSKMVQKCYDQIMQSRYCNTVIPQDPFLQVVNEPFDAEWFQTFPENIRVKALLIILSSAIDKMEPDDGPLACALDKRFLQKLANDQKDAFYSLVVSRLLLGGRIVEAREIISLLGSPGYTSGLAGWALFLEGKNAEAIASYEADLKYYRNHIAGRNDYFHGITGLFFILAQFKSRDASRLVKITRLIKKARSCTYAASFMLPAYGALDRICEIQKAHLDLAQASLSKSLAGHGGMGEFFGVFAAYWLKNKISGPEAASLQKISENARKAGWQWLFMECAALLSKAGGEAKDRYEEVVRKIQIETGMVSILDMVPHEELWEKSLRALVGPEKPMDARVVNQENTRLAWLFHFSDMDFQLQPVEQKRNKNGEWSTGRNVALKRLTQGTNLAYITEQDQRLGQTIRVESSYYYGTSYTFDKKMAALELVDHPRVFLMASPETPVSIEKGEPVVSVDALKSGFRLSFSPFVSGLDVTMVKKGPTRYEVISFTEEHKRIAAILGPAGLMVPLKGRDALLAAIRAVSSSVAVHSSIVDASEEVTEIESDAMPRMEIFPWGEGFRLELRVKPFGDAGPAMEPGKGNEILIASVHGKHMQVLRDLQREETLAAAVETGCPGLPTDSEDTRQWYLKSPEDCMQVLTELQAMRDRGDVVVEWPKGEALHVSREISFDRLHLRIRSKTDWFEVGGQLMLDDDQVLDMQGLLYLIQKTDSRFIPLGDNRFAALTALFRRRLSDLDAFGQRKGDRLQFLPLSALLLAEFVENLPYVDGDPKWQETIQRIADIRTRTPVLPSTLKAQLREYQQTGYQWMTRLSQWGMGACLADDMGLGKTVQALAVLLNRASEGPALIVAPTSVCPNWISEAGRFAPTLNVVLLGSGDRTQRVLNLKAFDVMVTSYGLLHQESELLASIDWHTVILDEAQAIKNIAAKRSQAAMQLRGDFRIITTGTPIENHLGELWTLFNFINPGLLGSLKQFNERFVQPIVRDNDRHARRRLKKLIQPFILRRTKTEVLEELPPRTDVILHVEMGREEASFYEALRLNALEKLEQDTGPVSQRYLKVLAEIMRLRRACCHPRLILPDSTLSSAKLELFGQLVAELLENHHKALVFSQFVGHLAILRQYLDEKGIDYRYLDGSTPARERQRQVDGFQRGEGDLFLISLRAGGLGLNLTAASYVIHMDPWWNPAVEDQASDRAHRIGQQHPVTVYRLVTRGTIEEKIIGLHQQKRELADSLLEGTDMSGKVSAEELIRLIREK